MAIMKRLVSPKFWPIKRKVYKYAPSPKPGPHSKKNCIPLAIILRDILGFAENMKEVKQMINNSLVKIDGSVIKETSFPVGLMDILSIGRKNYIVLPSPKGMMIKESKRSDKLMKIKNITINKKNKIQLNLHDGKNILVDKDGYKTNDVIVFSFKEKKIKKVIKFEKGVKAVIISGKNAGKTGKVKDIIVTKSSQPNKVLMDIESGTMEIPQDYVFAIGDEL